MLSNQQLRDVQIGPIKYLKSSSANQMTGNLVKQ